MRRRSVLKVGWIKKDSLRLCDLLPRKSVQRKDGSLLLASAIKFPSLLLTLRSPAASGGPPSQ
jgi:hypothetical protein